MKRFLKCMPHGQAYVEENLDGTKNLISYRTNVATIDPKGWLSVRGLYSATTKRHLTAFVDEYVHGCQSRAEQGGTQTYQMIKALYEGGLKMNIHTGEVADI